MPISADTADLTVGIVGSGTMGRGIAQLAAAAGCRVLLADARPQAAAEARAGVAETFARLAAKGKMTADAAAAAAARLDAPADPHFLGCAVVVEAIAEDLAAKQALFVRLEEEVAPDCVLATNTSSLSVTAIAAACRHPERVAGFHFFNPVPLMRIVEVVSGCRTDPGVAAFLRALGTRMGHAAVAASDSPGFIVNHAGRGYGPEALRLLDEGVADAPTIDRILVEQAGFRMGPFELFDLVGLDISAAVMDSLYAQFMHEPRYRPSPTARQRVQAGLMGRKTGRGFYEYREGTIVRPPEAGLPDAPEMMAWVSRTHPAEGERLASALAAAGVQLDPGERPGAASLCLTTPLGADATTTALAEGLDPRHTLAVDPLFGFEGRRVAMPTLVTAPAFRDAGLGVLARAGHTVSLIRDSAGFVAQRVLAMIVNIACEIAHRRIATPADIDRAVALGLGYPQGPLAWGDALGAGRIREVLETVHRLTGDPRYRPSPWLRRRAGLGVPLTTPE